MPSRERLFRLNDILDALARIHEYTISFNLHLFELGQRTIDAVLRKLEIIGEAVRHVPGSLVQEYSHTPWKYMLDMRNILIHEYFGIRLSGRRLFMIFHH